MPRAFLCWVAGLCAVSWVGITLVEIGLFSAWVCALAGLLAAGAVAVLVPQGARQTPGGVLVPALALLLSATLFPAIDTTLLSQDASIHVAAGRWLAREGTLAIPDATLEPVSEADRLALFSGGSLTPRRLSMVRLPGGIVIPDLHLTTAFPSFSHLLSVWIAIAESLLGPVGVELLGPLFAFTAWWAIGIVALRDAGRLAALAVIALLATWLPQHWFGRFLMPEILAQALVWAGVAAARLADDSGDAVADVGAARLRRVAGILCGLSFGIAGFARLEQFWVFVPVLLLVRALLPSPRRVFPPGALVPFLITAGQAALHLLIIPTDYGNRIYKAGLDLFAGFVVLVSMATSHDGYKTAFLLRWVFPVLLILLLIGAVWLGVRLERRQRGGFARLFAALLSVPWLILLYRRGLPEDPSVIYSLLWYVPWPAWGAALLGLPSLAALAPIETVLFLEALDQVVIERVTPEHVWASRRLVVLVLPVVALVAARALAFRGDTVGQVRRIAAGALIATALLIGAAELRPFLGRSVQGGARDFVADVAAEIPPGSTVLVAQPLDWAHLAAALWLDGGRRTLVMREQGYPGYATALESYLQSHVNDPLFLLAGEVGPADAEVDPSLALARIPDSFEAKTVANFRWKVAMLETTQDRRPEEFVERRAVLRLYRLERRP